MSQKDTQEEKPVIVPEVPAVIPEVKEVIPPTTPEPAVVPPAEDKGTPAIVPEKKPEDAPPVVPEKRPVAYIPLKKYHEETGELKKKITELEALVSKPDSKGPVTIDDDAIQAYADKYGMETEAVVDLLALLPKPETAMSPDALKEFNSIVEGEKARKAKEYETKDWNENAVPTLKELFPTATEAQLKKAQEFLDPIAHTEEGVNQGYDFIVFKNKSNLASIFGTTEETPKVPTTKATLETGKLGTGNPQRLTAQDFSTENPDFSLLDQLSPEDKKSLVKGFDVPTYKKYLTNISKNTPLEVNRDGKKILLK